MYCTYDTGAVFMEEFGGFRNTRFFVALQASPGTGRRILHEHSPEFHAKAMLAVHRSFGPAALVCKRAASARAVCVRMPVTRPKALFPKGYGAYFLQGRLNLHNVSRGSLRIPSASRSIRRVCAGCSHAKTTFHHNHYFAFYGFSI